MSASRSAICAGVSLKTTETFEMTLSGSSGPRSSSGRAKGCAPRTMGTYASVSIALLPAPVDLPAGSLAPVPHPEAETVSDRAARAATRP